MFIEHLLGARCCHGLRGEVTHEGKLTSGLMEWDMGTCTVPRGWGHSPQITQIIFWTMEAPSQDHVDLRSRACVLNPALGVGGLLPGKTGMMPAAF